MTRAGTPGPATSGSYALPAHVFWLGIALVTLLDVVLAVTTHTASRLSPLLIVLPAFAAGLGSVRQTVIASAWAMAGLWASFAYEPPAHRAEAVAASIAALAFQVLAVTACSWRTARQHELDRLRSTLVTLQRQILRPLPVVTRQVMLEGLYAPVEEDRMVGGDIYEVVSSPYGTRVLIGDVQGKGLAAIGTGFAVLGAFREAAFREPTLTAVVDALEDAVVRHNAYVEENDEPSRFVTALALGIDDEEGVQVVNCGHLQPYLLDVDGSRPVPIPDTAVPLGLAALADDPRTVGWFDLPERTTLLLYTDGVTEARDPDGRFYPLDARLPALAPLPPAELLAALRADIDRFTAGARRDDIAALTVRRTPSQWRPTGNLAAHAAPEGTTGWPAGRPRPHG
ncbi:PP2C family protein-serine/threonine phosphatase [Kitasatospora sp. NPDC057015]|uniref:PP2C family protein-serine/threonine phosphatase n=1 Tax=Kitasatospora sp. NPDC057015 TaxID=3346001 RepID=UPI00363B232E